MQRQETFFVRGKAADEAASRCRRHPSMSLREMRATGAAIWWGMSAMPVRELGVVAMGMSTVVVHTRSHWAWSKAGQATTAGRRNPTERRSGSQGELRRKRRWAWAIDLGVAILRMRMEEGWICIMSLRRQRIGRRCDTQDISLQRRDEVACLSD